MDSFPLGRFSVARIGFGAMQLPGPGVMGPPRDRDNRSCYVTFDGEVVEFHRLEYDFRKTMQKIIAAKGIPKRFAERLEVGK